MATIPIDKALHFRTKSRKNNPEGRSILRSAYRAWYFKRRIQEIEGVGIERDLAGLPTLTAPPGVDIWNTDDLDMAEALRRSETIVRNIRRDATEGIVLPEGWKLELLSAGGSRQFDTNSIIERYDTRIAMSTMSDFLVWSSAGRQLRPVKRQDTPVQHGAGRIPRHHLRGFQQPRHPAFGWHERRTLPWNYGVPQTDAWRR